MVEEQIAEGANTLYVISSISIFLIQCFIFFHILFTNNTVNVLINIMYKNEPIITIEIRFVKWRDSISIRTDVLYFRDSSYSFDKMEPIDTIYIPKW